MWSCTNNKTKFLTKYNKTKFLTNYKKTNVRFLHIFNNKNSTVHHYNIRGLKIHLSDFLKASTS